MPPGFTISTEVCNIYFQNGNVALAIETDEFGIQELALRLENRVQVRQLLTARRESHLDAAGRPDYVIVRDYVSVGRYDNARPGGALFRK